MVTTLSKEEREGILSSVSSKQKEFIQEHVKRGKKTVFANIMAKDKGIVLSDHATNEELEMLLDEWILEDYIDNGFVNPETKCECGRPLRYQYIVKHKRTNELRRFGISHFEEHTSIPSAVVQNIKKGFYEIDYEMDELLYKIHNNWNLNKVIPNIPDGYIVPKDIEMYLEAEVPLLDRQIKRLKEQIREFLEKREKNQEQEREEIESIVDFLPTDDNQFSFGLFDEPIERMDREGNYRMGYNKQYNYSLSLYHQNEVLDYLKKGVSSTRVICELLIKNNNADPKRYITGKPKIYASVCCYLDSLVQEGVLEIEVKDITDRVYILQDLKMGS
uniref:DUF3895 domain-containing protein n=1 Tax=Bacillus multifaciens TaxID=3068506 RepID=UPI003F49938A